MSYDHWKTTDPPQDGPVCDKCGGWIYRDWFGSIFCESCEENERFADLDAGPEELDSRSDVI